MRLDVHDHVFTTFMPSWSLTQKNALVRFLPAPYHAVLGLWRLPTNTVSSYTPDKQEENLGCPHSKHTFSYSRKPCVMIKGVARAGWFVEAVSSPVRQALFSTTALKSSTTKQGRDEW